MIKIDTSWEWIAMYGPGGGGWTVRVGGGMYVTIHLWCCVWIGLNPFLHSYWAVSGSARWMGLDQPLTALYRAII